MFVHFPIRADFAAIALATATIACEQWNHEMRRRRVGFKVRRSGNRGLQMTIAAVESGDVDREPPRGLSPVSELLGQQGFGPERWISEISDQRGKSVWTG